MPFVAVDPEGLLVEINELFESVYGWMLAGLTGQSLSMILPDFFKDAHHPGFSRFLMLGESQILIADDSRVNQRVLELMLARLGLRAELVGDGQAALDRIESGGIDLVFMDVEMPRLDGLAAPRLLRSGGFPDVYIVA
ncbi:response regulator [Synechococcus sp. 1G10]|uniref:response regulator n=1 Tax=Synechococcus sp. 1G10 TaxID=2025605 RepID=UPI001303BA4C|nr:response regulator [Synechococcus sp. 1G10]